MKTINLILSLPLLLFVCQNVTGQNTATELNPETQNKNVANSINTTILDSDKTGFPNSSALSIEFINEMTTRAFSDNPEDNNIEYNIAAPPPNDNCANAITLTPGNPLQCGQNSTDATMQLNECFVDILGATESSMWYRFTATNDSLVLSFIQTNTTSLSPMIFVAGPFAPGTGCYPSAPCACAAPWYDFTVQQYQGSASACYLTSNGDPGNHMLLTGLSPGFDYLIRIQNNNSPPARWAQFCIGIAEPASNTTPSGSSVIDECGTSFSGNTNIGNYPSGSSLGFNNLDNNAGTTVGGASQAGDDVTYIINNDSWFQFCAVNAGTWQVTINGIGSCQLSAPNAGVQASIFTGNPSSLTNIYSFPSPMAPGSSNTSSTFAIGAGECAYVVVDGFAGDACNYSLSLTNIAGGCILLPIELNSFDVVIIGGKAQIRWSTSSESNNDYFTVMKSSDSDFFKPVGKIQGAGNSNVLLFYDFEDSESISATTYYRLKQTDFNGDYSYSEVISVSPKANESRLNSLYISNISPSNFQFVFNGVPEKEYQYSIINISGQKIASATVITDISGKGSGFINNPGIIPGLYLFSVTGGSESSHRKFAVIR